MQERLPNQYLTGGKTEAQRGARDCFSLRVKQWESQVYKELYESGALLAFTPTDTQPDLAWGTRIEIA